MGLETAEYALAIASGLSLLEVIARYFDYRGSHFRSFASIGYLVLYIAASGVFAALIALLVVNLSRTSSASPEPTGAFAILSALTAFGILRIGFAGTKIEKSLSGPRTASGSEEAIGVMRSLLSVLLRRVDQAVHDAYMEYLAKATEKLVKGLSWTYGEKSGTVVAMCAQLSGLEGPTSSSQEGKLELFRNDVVSLGGQGFDDAQKRFLLVRCCVHHVGRRFTKRALKRL